MLNPVSHLPNSGPKPGWQQWVYTACDCLSPPATLVDCLRKHRMLLCCPYKAVCLAHPCLCARYFYLCRVSCRVGTCTIYLSGARVCVMCTTYQCTCDCKYAIAIVSMRL